MIEAKGGMLTTLQAAKVLGVQPRRLARLAPLARGEVSPRGAEWAWPVRFVKAIAESKINHDPRIQWAITAAVHEMAAQREEMR